MLNILQAIKQNTLQENFFKHKRYLTYQRVQNVQLIQPITNVLM